MDAFLGKNKNVQFKFISKNEKLQAKFSFGSFSLVELEIILQAGDDSECIAFGKGIEFLKMLSKIIQIPSQVQKSLLLEEENNDLKVAPLPSQTFKAQAQPDTEPLIDVESPAQSEAEPLIDFESPAQSDAELLIDFDSPAQSDAEPLIDFESEPLSHTTSHSDKVGIFPKSNMELLIDFDSTSQSSIPESPIELVLPTLKVDSIKKRTLLINRFNSGKHCCLLVLMIFVIFLIQYSTFVSFSLLVVQNVP